MGILLSENIHPCGFPKHVGKMSDGVEMAIHASDPAIQRALLHDISVWVGGHQMILVMHVMKRIGMATGAIGSRSGSAGNGIQAEVRLQGFDLACGERDRYDQGRK